MSGSKLFLIDAHALCYRSYYAIQGLTTAHGQATNAVFGFVSTLQKILKEFKPEYLAVCFDSKGKTFREKKFTEYKIQRPVMPDDLISQIPIIKDIMAAYQIPVFELTGFEADDIIATIVGKTRREGLDVVIVSDDKDMYQLADDHVKFYSTRKGEMLTEKQVKEKLGYDPKMIVDFIGLAGDQTDNIPGVRGIGEVTARKLLNEHGSLENILKHLDLLSPPGVREKITASQSEALLSKDLATLEMNVPIEVDLNKMKLGSPDKNRLFKIFKELEFKRLSDEFAIAPQADKKIVLVACDEPKDIKVLKKEITVKAQFSFAVERTDDGSLKDVIIGIGESKIYRVDKSNLSQIKEIFEDPRILKITYHVKDSFKALLAEGIILHAPIFDCLLAGHLLSPSRASLTISDLGWEYGKQSFDEEDIAGTVDAAHSLYSDLSKQLKEKSLIDLFERIETPLAIVIAKMEWEGVNLDEALLGELSKSCSAAIDRLTQQLYSLTGEEFNINSPKQLSHILFNKLKLPVVKKTKTGFSTNEEVLTILAKQHDVPNLILEYRQYTKLKSTYIDAFPQLINHKTGKLHAEFDQTGTETGRLSSRNPNLQNIPIRTELGREIRKAFVPSKKSNLFISADYSQIELRILAHLSGDENLKKAFYDDQDVHNYTASLMFDIKEKDVTYEMRNSAKRVNFGIIYGMSAFGLAKDLDISQGQAQDFIDKYFLRYPKVKKFLDDQIKFCEKNGFVVTLLNRRRYIPEINNENQSIRMFAQRQAVNTPVQGSAADLIKLAMINVQDEIEAKGYESRMIITVHDELVFDVPKPEMGKMIEVIRSRMEHPVELSVPIKVSIKSGPNWLEVKEV